MISRKLETLRGYVQASKNVFYQLRFNKTIVLFRSETWLYKKPKLFITVFTTILWMKRAWPAESILLTLTLQLRDLSGVADQY